ncbi:MAG TPA: cadherin-like domain-containing protein [Gemmatimonadales bacterium]
MQSLARTLLAASVSLALAAPAHAALERMGPINYSSTVGGFPSWFQDKTGVALEFCDPINQAELNGGWCTILPPNPATAPESFPNNFFIEHFYSDAVSTIKDANAGVRAKLVVAVEASFANGTQVVPGQQMTFGRIRVFITNVPFSGTYTVYHPYGKWIFPNVAAGDRIFFTEDIGLACVNTFECTLGTNIGPFLLPSAAPGGAEVPPIPDIVPGQDPYYDILVNTGAAKAYPGTGKKYIADPGRIGPVTGSPLPPFVGNDGATYNHNVFRLEGPNGYTLSSTDFSTNGRVMTGQMTGQVAVDRASYAQTVASTTGKKLDVFATGTSTSAGRVPAQPAPAAVTPVLSFFDAPCAGTIDPNTGATLPPYSAPLNATETTMVAADTKYWGQSHPSVVPAAVCVKDASTRDAAGNLVPTFYMASVTDETTQPGGSTATYDSANGGTLIVKAQSSDNLTPPILTLAGYGATLSGTPPTATVTPLAAPPSKVTILSSEGSSSDMLVQTAVGAAGGGPVPLANNDAYTMYEDCSATPATSCATPLVFNPLANDTVNGAPVPAGSTVTITSQPRIGAVVLNADGSMTYTPNANANGLDGISYTVTVNGAVSNAANIAINITPVNDIPTAVNDVTDSVVARVNRVNVLANDTDPDGAADLASAQIVTWPVQLGAQPVPNGGVISFTPTSTGTFSFTYNALDKAGAVSPTPATVTVNVLGSEAITIAKAIYKVGNQGGAASARWTVSGTDSVREGQTMTIVYNNGTLNAANGGGSCNGTASNPKCVIGTAVVDGVGNFLYDQVLNPGGPTDPTDTTTWSSKPNSINVFSSSPVLGGSRTSSIALK